MPKVAVIVPGAGSGKRFGGGQNKIFAKIHDQPMFIHTLEVFTALEDVVQTIFVCSAKDAPDVKERFGGHLGFMGVTLIEGGATRSQSVRNALAKVADEAELIAVHDAARPCVSRVWVQAVFAEADKTGAALLALPLHGTLKRVSASGVVDETLPREKFDNLWEAQTPQVFRKDLLLQAYAAGRDATDDAALIEALGHPVSVVPGDPRNIKVTTPNDLTFARAVVQTLPRPRETRPFHPFQEGQW